MLFVLGDGRTGRLKGTAGGDLVNTVSTDRMRNEYHAGPLIHEVDCSRNFSFNAFSSNHFTAAVRLPP
jgi:hypothetical protein